MLSFKVWDALFCAANKEANFACRPADFETVETLYLFCLHFKIMKKYTTELHTEISSKEIYNLWTTEKLPINYNYYCKIL